MKVVHANTQTYGGAAIVAIRLHRALRELNVDSSIVTRYGVSPSTIPSHKFFESAKLMYFLRKKAAHGSLYYVAKFIQGLRPHPNLANKPGGYEIFSPLTSYTIPDHNPFDNADIIHLHWVNNFVNYSSFFERHKTKRFVWTLHDMNPITGGCHHSDGCMKFQDSCMHCPQLKNTINDNYSNEVLNAKINGINVLKDDQLVIVSPSSWLLGLSKTSQITKRFRHMLIDNPAFDVPENKQSVEALRRELNLPLSKKIVLFVCDNIRNPRKGIQVLFDAVRKAGNSEQIRLVAIGNRADAPRDLSITFVGSISNPELLSKYYAAADVFVTPSIADNAPLVVIEALTCGTPVIGSNVGGIPELIGDEKNGMTFPVGDVSALADQITRVLFETKYDRSAIRTLARQRFDSGYLAGKYLAIYKGILQTR